MVVYLSRALIAIAGPNPTRFKLTLKGALATKWHYFICGLATLSHVLLVFSDFRIHLQAMLNEIGVL
jgi:hypothetical protein